VTITNLIEFAHEIDSKRATLLEEAERYAGLEWFRTSYNLFRRVLPAADILYSVVDYVIQEGDYLTLIANQFDTTVQAILEANDLQNPAGIGSGQKISIPTIREKDD
jgi:nucleoid-associated protein YgaU